MSITVSCPCFINSDWMLSTPVALPLFSARIPASASAHLSVRYFPCLSWTVLTLDCLCCERFHHLESPLAFVLDEVHFYLCALCLYSVFSFLIFLLISLYASAPFLVFFAFFRSLLWSHRSRILLVTHGRVVTHGCFRVFFLQDFICRLCHHCTEFTYQCFGTVIKREQRCKFPTDSCMEGIFSLSRLNFSLLFICFLVFASLTLKFSITRSRSLPTSSSGKVRPLL